ncbi:hypothetical protein ACFPYI_19230 [Halomarina salina]|uniref:CARDB domain-containing protein n=1 Tax=Halomarina salina TaxID=1872699 RepID=A0ABD5RS41_9EURY|nr:hypothetical protein [Halomarina salina]
MLAVTVILSTTTGFVAAATSTDLTATIAGDSTVAPGQTATVEIAVTDVDGGVGAADFGVELSSPGVATITDVSVENAGSSNNEVASDGQSANLQYAFADTTDTGSIVIAEVTVQATAEGTTDIEIGSSSNTGNLVVYDENGAGYTVDSVGSATLTVENVNQPPTADAGDDQTVGAGDTVSLDGSESTDPNPEDTLDYEWSQVGNGPQVTLSDNMVDNPTFTAPDVTSATTLTFELLVTDDDGDASTDTVEVTVQPPDAAFYELSNLQAPGSATQGDNIDISIDVENTGGQTATKNVEFRVDTDDDGSIADESALTSESVQLGPGASTTVSFDDVDTSGLPTGTLTHGVVTADDSAVAQITIEEPPEQPTKATTVSFQPTDASTAVGVSTTYQVVVDSAQGGVGAGEFRIAVDDSAIAQITDVNVLGSGSTSTELASDGSWVDVDYAFRDTPETGSVVFAEVTVEATSAGTTSLGIEPAAGNSDVLLFDEEGAGYTVTGTSGSNLEVVAVEFLVDNIDAPEKAAVGSTISVNGQVTNDGSVESTQPVELYLDTNGDEILELVETKQVTIDAGETVTVSFDVDVPANAPFGDHEYGIVTSVNSATGSIEFTPPAVSENQPLPGDLDGDGLFEDVNGDGQANVGDAQSLFSNRDDAAVQQYVAQYDFNDDGVVNVGDAQALFSLITGSDDS